MNLYRIDQQYLAIASELVENGGELTPEIESALTFNLEQVQEAAKNIGLVIRTLDAESEMIENEIKRLTAMKRSRQNALERFKTAIAGSMLLHDMDKFESATVKLSFRKSESVEVDDMEKLPAEYVTVKVVRTPDKIKIKEAIKSGESIPGATLVINQNLQVK